MFQDWEYHLRLLAWHPKIGCVDQKLTAARQHDLGRIGDKWNNGSGLFGALTALNTITEETAHTCCNIKHWQQAIARRGKEIMRQADKTDFPLVYQAALHFVKNFAASFNFNIDSDSDSEEEN